MILKEQGGVIYAALLLFFTLGTVPNNRLFRRQIEEEKFHAGLVEHARFEGTWQMPVIPTSDVMPEKPVAVGTHGCIQHREDRQYFLRGLKAMVERLHPSAVIVYGQAPDKLFQPCFEAGIPIYPFDSRILTVHRREVQ